jgi:GT2 family glycosyltransferase
MSRIEPAYAGSRSYSPHLATRREDRLQTGCFEITAEQPKGSAVIISTRGRPNIVSSLVKQLALQSLPPDHIFVVATGDEDVAELDFAQKNLTVTIGRPGSTFQRNDGLKLAGADFSYIIFFDDDFVPSRFWIERMSQIFESRPDIAGMTGDMLADGTRTAGIDLAVAKTQVQLVDSTSAYNRVIEEDFAYGSNVGCNMAYRYSTMHDITFDERLPLYAWHEDSDFRGQVTRRGKFVHARSLCGVHLGHKKGRGSGVTLGYSQIANALYLARKGTVPAGFLAGLALKNIVINIFRSIRPEPFVDRRGRMRGNFIAILDLIRGRLAPERILNLQ